MKHLRYIRFFVVGAITAYLIDRLENLDSLSWFILFIVVAVVYTLLELLIEHLISKNEK